MLSVQKFSDLRKYFLEKKPLKKIIINITCIVGLVFFDTVFLILFGRSIFSLISHFDKTLHFVTGMLLADIYYCLPFKKNIFRITMFVLAVSIAWESIEPLLDTTNPFLTLSWLIDTIGNTASAIFGEMTYGFFKKHYDKYAGPIKPVLCLNLDFPRFIITGGSLSRP